MSHGDDGDLTRPARRLFDVSPAHPSLPADRMCFSTATLFRVMSARHHVMVCCVGAPLTGAQSVGLNAAITSQSQPKRRHASIADPSWGDGVMRSVRPRINASSGVNVHDLIPGRIVAWNVRAELLRRRDVC